MILEEFASVVLSSKVLTVDEVSDIVKYLSSVKGVQVGFPVSKRGAIIPDKSLGTLAHFSSICQGNLSVFSPPPPPQFNVVYREEVVSAQSFPTLSGGKGAPLSSDAISYCFQNSW